MSDYFLIYRDSDCGGRVVKKYLHRAATRWSWRAYRPGAARFHTLTFALDWANRWRGAKIERRT